MSSYYTIYVSNLPSEPITLIRQNLYALFSTYGEVLDINTKKELPRQAFVVLNDEDAGRLALRELEGFEFFGKKLKVEVAKQKSHLVENLENGA
jgi:RNA recognition motif-containing protein